MGVKSSPFVLVVSLVTCKRFTLATRSRYKRMYKRASARHIGDSCGGFNKHDNKRESEACCSGQLRRFSSCRNSHRSHCTLFVVHSSNPWLSCHRRGRAVSLFDSLNVIFIFIFIHRRPMGGGLRVRRWTGSSASA